MESKHFPAEQPFNYDEFIASLSESELESLDLRARLWFNVEKEYHAITGEWLQR